MSRQPCLFRETDVKRAIRAVRAAGVDVARVEIGKDGRIIVFPDKPSEAKNSSEETNEWDAVHGKAPAAVRP